MTRHPRAVGAKPVQDDRTQLTPFFPDKDKASDYGWTRAKQEEADAIWQRLMNESVTNPAVRISSDTVRAAPSPVAAPTAASIAPPLATPAMSSGGTGDEKSKTRVASQERGKQ